MKPLPLEGRMPYLVGMEGQRVVPPVVLCVEFCTGAECGHTVAQAQGASLFLESGCAQVLRNNTNLLAGFV